MCRLLVDGLDGVECEVAPFGGMDAAGQCLALTGEGIRPALVWGQEAGRQARRVLEGHADLFASGPVARVAQHAYWTIADPDTLRPVPAARDVARVPAEQCATGPATGTRPC